MAFPQFYDALDLPMYCDDEKLIYAAYMQKMEEFASCAIKGDSFIMYPGDLYFNIWYYNIAYLTLSDALHMRFTYNMGLRWRNHEQETQKKNVIFRSVAILVGVFLLFLLSILYDFIT